MRVFLSVLVCSLLVACSATAQIPRESPRYYILAQAKFQTPEDVWIFGASNLPVGALLTINLYDFIGEGSHVLAEPTEVTVGKNGLFETVVHPNRPNNSQRNTICSVVFSPDYPPQPKDVLSLVGKHGQNLGNAPDNPQARTTSGGRILVLDTIVLH
jgi:hypothetical protein